MHDAGPPSATPVLSPESGGEVALIDWPRELDVHGRWLRTVLRARLRSADAVEEVMQEVALATVRQTTPLRDAAKIAPWLYRIALHQALMYRRACGRRRKLYDQVARHQTQHATSGPCDPLTWLVAEERRSLVRQAMARLRSRDAEILLLKYAEQWNYQQIADHLGLSHSAIEARLHRARQRLREQLAQLSAHDTHD